MSFKWQKATARDGNIITAKGFNGDYDQYKSTINGGIDRDNLPEDCISGSTMVQDKAFHAYYYESGLEAESTLCDSDVAGRYGVVYDLYSGGWYSDSVNIEESFREGLLTIEFSCWLWLWDDLGTTSNNQFCEFQITIDGNPVAYSERIYNNMTTVHMVATLPISSGTHKIEMRWKFSSPDMGITVSNTTPIFYYSGGQLLAINRVR